MGNRDRVPDRRACISPHSTYERRVRIATAWRSDGVIHDGAMRFVLRSRYRDEAHYKEMGFMTLAESFECAGHATIRVVAKKTF